MNCFRDRFDPRWTTCPGPYGNPCPRRPNPWY